MIRSRMRTLINCYRRFDNDHLLFVCFTVFAYEFNNNWIKLVLDKLRDESGGDNSLCEKIILRPDCNLLEMCQYDGFTDTETEALLRSYLSQNSNG